MQVLSRVTQSSVDSILAEIVIHLYWQVRKEIGLAEYNDELTQIFAEVDLIISEGGDIRIEDIIDPLAFVVQVWQAEQDNGDRGMLEKRNFFHRNDQIAERLASMIH